MTSWQSWKTNFCAALFVGVLATPAAFATTLSIVATPNPAVTTAPVSLNIVITDVTDLFGYNFSLAFDPTILQVTSATEGAFLASTGGNTFYDGGTIDNVAGTISFAFNTLISDVPGVTGSGIIQQYTFSVLKAGSTALTFSDVTFLNSDFGDIAVTAINSTLLATSPVVTPSIPEPGTYALMALGLAGLGVAARRRKTV